LASHLIARSRSLSRSGDKSACHKYDRSCVIWHPAILLALVAVVYFFPASFKVAAPIACGLALLFTVQLQVSIVRRLRSLAISEQYVSRFRLQSMLVQPGNLVSLSLLALAFIARLS